MSAAPASVLLLVFAGRVNRRQREVAGYLQEENRVLREQLGDRRLRVYRRSTLPACGEGQIPLHRSRRECLGGLLSYYYRPAA
jgi:hypothetical protein